MKMRAHKLSSGVFLNIKINWVFCITFENIIKGLIHHESLCVCMCVFFLFWRNLNFIRENFNCLRVTDISKL